jgi:hypothetical protein
MLISGLSFGIIAYSAGEPAAAPRVNAEADQGGAPAKQEFTYIGADSCQSCHESPNRKKTDFVQLTEWDIWNKYDKHSQAYQVLKWPRAQEMGAALKIDVTTDKMCLNCHAVNPPKNRREAEFKIEHGVNCEGCHGPASGWTGLHQLASWRSRTVADKESYGMLEVRDPQKRATMCASCHVGSEAEEKVVTHAMYAVGHPPLPSLETATFSNDLPRHWRNRRDVPYISEGTDEVKARYNFAQAPFEQSKLLLLSAAVALREEMELVKDQLRAEPGHERPEYAQFDCFACHHDLKAMSWRQARSGAERPGRPRIRPRPLALGLLAIRQVEPPATARALEDQLVKAMGKLDLACDVRVFGDPRQIEEAADGLSKWSDDLAKQVEKVDLNREALARMLQELCVIARERTPDYSTARQIAWGMNIIYGEYKVLDPKPAHDGEITRLLSRMERNLELRLNTSKDERAKTKTEENKAKDWTKELSKLSDDELKESLQAISNYDPADFLTDVNTLSELLKKRP